MSTETEQQFEQAAGDLSSELARMHGVLFKLLSALCYTGLTYDQALLVIAAMKELQASQERFFAKYATNGPAH